MSQGRRSGCSGTVLRGRDHELSEISDGLSSTAAGAGGVLLVEGPPGIGKSSLLTEARAMALRAGVGVLWGEAFESQQAVPFAPLLAATLDSPLRHLDSVRAARGDADLRYWMLHDLQGALESAAVEGPLALLLDDLQWADPGTATVLSTLPHRLAGSPVLWILAMRQREGHPLMREAMARLQRDGARRLRLDVLSERDVAAIVADVLDAEADSTLMELTARARGNPFLVVELLRGLRDEDRLREVGGQAVVVGDGLPRRVTDSMRDRLERLSEEAQRTVTLASALGVRFTASQLASMLQCRPSTLLPALAEAQRADLLTETGDYLRFRHDLLRQAVLETMPRTLQRAILREAATAMLQGGAAPVEVAKQLAENSEIGDRQAIVTLRQAARTLAGADVGVAANLSVRALELMAPEDAERALVVAETVVLLYSAMRPDDARALGEGALAGALSPEQEAEVRLSLSSMLTRSTAARAEDNRRALQLAGLTPSLRARHLGWLTYNLAVTGRLDEARSVGESAMASAEDSGDLQARVMTTLGMAFADSLGGWHLLALDRIDQLRSHLRPTGREAHLLLIEFHYASILVHVGRVDDALGLLAASVSRGQRDRNPWLLESWAQVGSLLRLAAGQLADASAEAESSATLVEEGAAGNFAGMAGLLTLAQVAVHTGDVKRLKSAVEAASRVPQDSSPILRRYAIWILALAAMKRGDPVAAADLLQDDDLPYEAPFLPGDVGHQPVVARLALAAGDPALARRALEAAELLVARSPEIPLIRAIAAHTRGLVRGDPADLIEAANGLRMTQRPLLFASAAEDAGAALALGGRPQEAVLLLTQALDAYLDCEAGADARRVKRRLRDSGVRRHVPARSRPTSGWESLTDSELRVARLVAQGATNRDAADRLFLSPHTVSTHLRNTFVKLAINSRVDLARLAIQDGDVVIRSPII